MDDCIYPKARHRDPSHVGSTETVLLNETTESLKIYRLKSIWE